MIERLLLLYPRRYRSEYGEEILAVHREATAQAPPLDRFREAADITAHAARMRLGVDSASPPDGSWPTPRRSSWPRRRPAAGCT
ncbi:hypothetical protein FNQ90_16970 [Streptomyces alkaliphilus]|uniref:Uncharacterized protein n=1 Tax=Streptomyces alkaliphilus TaxID=1472722 RepID=A0A7W3TFJ8_9ACTN|nr:hypothetical protein [Streptomyces alkaliphilus]MBB0245750.1 hypothetical protein [Streptomyces alkaliphilus]